VPFRTSSPAKAMVVALWSSRLFRQWEDRLNAVSDLIINRKRNTSLLSKSISIGTGNLFDLYYIYNDVRGSFYAAKPSVSRDGPIGNLYPTVNYPVTKNKFSSIQTKSSFEGFFHGRYVHRHLTRRTDTLLML